MQFHIYVHRGEERSEPRWNSSPRAGTELDAFCTPIHSNLILILGVRELRLMEVHKSQVFSPGPSYSQQPVAAGPDGVQRLFLLEAKSPAFLVPLLQDPSSWLSPNPTTALCNK